MNTRIKEIRIALGLTQKEFGENIGLSPNSLSDIEHKKCNVSERIIILVCSVYNVNEEWLRNGNGEMFNQMQRYDEFIEIYYKLNKPLQDFLIKCAKNLLDTQELL